MFHANLEYIIPAVALIIVQLIVSFKQDKVNDVKYKMTIDEIKKDITRLEEKQDKHNSLVERMAKLEQDDEAQWRYIDQFKTKFLGTK